MRLARAVFSHDKAGHPVKAEIDKASHGEPARGAGSRRGFIESVIP